MSYRGPKAKLSRRLGVALNNKSALVMARKPHGPGQHGASRRKKESEYGKQLLEKQRLRFQYNISEKQLRRYFGMAKSSKENTGNALIKVLEKRLDAIVLRSGFAPSIYAARQLVSHCHVLVNGKRVNKPSYLVNTEDVISIKPKSREMPIVKEAISQATVPPYIECDLVEMTSRFAREPEREEVPVICETPMVVEYYSK